MHRVDVYGADHSPGVQAVLLGLYDARIPHSLTRAEARRDVFDYIERFSIGVAPMGRREG